jgi:hypothetical protein
MPQIDLSILNQRQTPAFYADVLANRPAAGFIGRIFVSTDTYEFYRDNGTSWDIVGGPGSGTVTGGGSLYRVAIWNSTSSIGESNNLIFDFSTNRLGIGTNAPGAALDVHSAANSIAQFNQTTATNNSLLVLQNSGSALWRIGNYYNAGANDFGVFDVIGAQQPLTIKKTTGQVLIGTSTVGSGKLVVSSATSDNGIQIAGANAPSLRIDNAESGPTKRAGLGISTAVNNFIQGSADRDFCIFNGSTTASPMLFGIYDAGASNVQEAARISAARNFIVGSVTDTGQKFQVTGTTQITGITQITGQTFITGSTTASAGTARGSIISSTLVAAANSDQLIGLEINPTFNVGAFTGTRRFGLVVNNSRINFSGSYTSLAGESINPDSYFLINTSIQARTAASLNGVQISPTINCAGATAQVFTALRVSPTFTNTGTSTLYAISSDGPNLFNGPNTFTGTNQNFSGQAGSSNNFNISIPSTLQGFNFNINTGAAGFTYYRDAGNLYNYNLVNNSNNVQWIFPTGNTTIQTGGSFVDAGYKLDVAGTTRFQGTSRIDGDLQMFYTGVNTRSFNFYQQFGSSTLEIQMNFNTGTSNRVTLAGVNNELDFFSVTSNKAASATTTDYIFALGSTTKGFLPPRMTTVQKNAIRLFGGTTLTPGLVVYDTTLNKLCVYTGAAWETVTSV